MHLQCFLSMYYVRGGAMRIYTTSTQYGQNWSIEAACLHNIMALLSQLCGFWTLIFSA